MDVVSESRDRVLRLEGNGKQGDDESEEKSRGGGGGWEKERPVLFGRVGDRKAKRERNQRAAVNTLHRLLLLRPQLGGPSQTLGEAETAGVFFSG